jgi:tetratricopeptide (TPR) repeat protein
MGSVLARVVLGVGVAVAMLVLSGAGVGHAQSGPGASAPASAGSRATARKLVEEGIAAQGAKDYNRAVALYLKAFSLDPHPLLLFNVGQAHRLAGCPERAVPFYERYLTLEPGGKQAAAAQAALADIRTAAKPDKPHCSKAPTADEATGAVPAASSPGRLKLRSVPEGAVVMLDGVKIGVTPIERELAAGAHSIVLVDNGMLVGERSVEVRPGAVVEVTIPIERRSAAPPPKRASRLAPALLWAGGGLALAGSGVAFYLGQQGGREHPEDRYIYRGATTTGYVLVGAGAAAIGAGVWFWVRGSRESAPIAAIGPDGSYLGWQGRF